MENVNSNPTNLREHSPSENEWRQLPKDYWFYLYSGGCTQPHSVMRRTDGGCTAVCSSPWTYPGVEAEMRSIADRHNTALAASGTEAAPSKRIIVTHPSQMSAEALDAGAIGEYVDVPAQAAASPEGEGREATKAEAEVWLERNGYPYLEQLFNEFVDGPITRSRMNSLLAPLFAQFVLAQESKTGAVTKLTLEELKSCVHVDSLDHGLHWEVTLKRINETLARKTAAAQPQRESEQRNVSERSVAGTCDSPFVAAGSKQLGIAPQIIDRCELQYGHAGQHKNGNASWGVQRESEQPEQVAKLTDKILTELFKQYSGKEFKSFRHALRRNLEPILRAALSTQTDSQEPR